MASPRAHRSILSLVVALLVLAPAQAQTAQFDDYAEAAVQARDQGKTLLVYFYSSVLNHPTRLGDLLVDAGVADAVGERFVLVNLDIESEPGRALAEAFYSRSLLDEGEQRNAVLVVEKSVSSRGFSLLGPAPDLIDAAAWNAFVAKVSNG